MAKKTAKRPRQAELPGTEDSAIKALEDAGARYAEIRDERIELNVSEAKLKKNLITLMHKHGKTIYRRHGIEIELVAEEETVKVRIKKPAKQDDES